MNEEQTRNVMNRLADDLVPNEIDLWPAIRKQIDSQPNLKKRASGRTRQFNLAVGISVVLVLTLAIVSFTPTGKAFAQALQNFFRVVTADQLPTPRAENQATPTFAPTFAAAIGPVSPQPPATLEPMPTSSYDPALAPCYSDITSYECKIAQAEKRAGFDAKEFPVDPKGFVLSQVISNPGMIALIYESIGGGSEVYLGQWITDEPFSLGSVAQQGLEEVMVGKNRGQYVHGDYVITGDPPELTWMPVSRFRLTWMEGDRMYGLEVGGTTGADSPDNDRDYLIELAENLVYAPEPRGIRADFLTNIEDAAQMAGFIPLEPSILPEDFHFDHGQYDADTFTLRLDYYLPEKGIGHVLVWETPIDKAYLTPELEESIVEGEEVEINGYPGQYYGIDPYSHAVIWYTNDLRIKIKVWVSDIWYGGSLTKEEILEIVNSVQ